MPLAPGTQVGPYEILDTLGSGGMGDVHRARDTRLGRDVALKTIRALENPSDIQRFEAEARATSGINHPNIVVLYDVGTYQGHPYLVTELLEGETLRARMLRGAIPASKAVEYARQIAAGLAAAHDSGIVHRDLKPENIFLTRDGHLKLLDFGLAKPIARASADAETMAIPAGLTTAGMIVGTFSYMSPEQVQNEPLDARSDLFAFGAVLFEMFAGRPAFGGRTAVDVMHAVLNRMPEAFDLALKSMPPAVAFVVRGCLEKDPRARLQSAHDVAQFLAAPADAAPAAHSLAAGPRALRWPLLAAVAALLVASALAGGFFLARRTVVVDPPGFHQLTFRRGYVDGARFSGDGHTVMYSATWEGAPLELFSTRVESPESRPLDVRPASLLSISRSGELAAAINRRQVFGFVFLGTLASMPLVGGRPRELATDVGHADWSPDGAALAAIRSVGGRFRLEYPLGKVVYESAGWMADVRVSHNGRWIAFVEHPIFGDDRGDICAIGPDGHKQVLAAGWASATGLAWSPREDEIWFTASAIGPNTSLWSVTTGGRKRQLLGPVGRMTLLDAEADGRLLVSQGRIRIVMAHRAELTAGDRILSWLDASAASDMSPDGSTLVFDEQGEGSQGNGYAVYLRKTDGSPAVRLGEGYGGALSKDLQWVAALRIAPARAVVLLPTGAGEARVLDRGPLRDLTAVTWMPDMQSVLISGQEDGKSPRLYLQPVSGGPPRAVSPDGFSFPTYASVVSPDGRWAAALNADKLPFLVSLADGTAHRLENAGAGDTPLRWTPDSSAVFLGRLGELPVTIWRVPQSGGRRERVTAIEPADRAGFIGVGSVQITPDGRQVAYSVGQYLADLYLTDPIR